ncbi:probable cytochrome P450 6a23 [Anthonomus grandis grandis]|uniref:probable cytochrome P450 6a23 n=1 Tax=Anthonomus grandis grandis TaxID=2921223 RepID=UPI0021659752|nr:probable cytochrome P450 6a23 [Anthonomus grandis grandis]
MNLNSVCFDEQLPFLQYINQYYLVYSLTLVSFATVFGLVWILKQYTYFEKHKIIRGKTPVIPYGNFGEVIKQEVCLHVFLWKQYKKFKSKQCKVGGLYLFLKPTLVDCSLSYSDLQQIFPREPGTPKQGIIKDQFLDSFVEKFNNSMKKALADKLTSKEEHVIVFRDFILESTCLAFGFNCFEIIEPINRLLKLRSNLSLKYYLSLIFPLLQTKPLHKDLTIFLKEAMEQRKKTDKKETDFIQAFISFYNESTNISMNDLSEEVYNMFADMLTYSYSTLIFCLYELANAEEVQEELLGEIRRFNNKHGSFSYENIVELEYMDAVIKETLRKYPPISTIIRSSGSRSLENIPCKGTLVLQSILGIHRDPEFYLKPETFDPDRFLQTQMSESKTFLPFGTGPDNKFYTRLITLQVGVVLISIFSRLKVKMKKDSRLNYNPKVVYLSPKEDLNFSFTAI